MRALPFGLLVSAALLLAGCGGDAPKRDRKPPEKAKAKAAASADTGPAAIVPLVPYAYSPVGKKDPFRSPVEEIRDKDATCQEPLCQWDLDQLSLVAIVTGDSSPMAMVEDPQGRGHIVRRNTRMGKQGGKVTQILRDSLTITEYWRQPDGRMMPNPVSMQLKSEKTTVRVQDLVTGREM